MPDSEAAEILQDIITLTLRAGGRSPITIKLPLEGETIYMDHETRAGKYQFAIEVRRTGFRVAGKEKVS